jgi:D-xylose transport system permease protein
VSTELHESQPEAPETATAEAAVRVAAPEIIAGSLGEYAEIWWRRVRSGESGALPVIVGLIAIVVYFQVRSSLFLSAGNLVNLMTQAAWIITLGMAEVFVLLLGEIDLSIGYSSAIGAVIMLWLLSVSNSVPWWLAVLAGLAFTSAYGAVQGIIITRLKLPSFVVTLAGLLLGQGLLLYVINAAAPNSGGTIRLTSSVLNDIENGSMSPAAGWIVMAVAVVLTGAYMVARDGRRRASNLAAPPVSVTMLKVALIAVAAVTVDTLARRGRAAQ